jgi:uncharacterized protein
MIHFEGVEQFSGPLADVQAKLSDAEFLARNLPDATVSEATADRAAWKVRPKLAFISGDLDTVLTVLVRTPDGIKYCAEAKGVGSASVIEAALTFAAAADGGTTVTWTGDVVSMSGLMKLAPKGLVQATAQKVIADCWAALKAKV